MKQLTRQELFDFFEAQKREHYQKRGKFIFRPAIPGETILTITNGKLETINKAKEGDVILRNIELGSSAEIYIIVKDLFEKKYEIIAESYSIDNQAWTGALAKGKIEAFCFYNYPGELSINNPIQLMAPWDELMICNPGDFIARPLEGTNEFDIYRIDKDTFNITYKKRA